jgi:DNA (cytosine-5)-methyltransferase 1
MSDTYYNEWNPFAAEWLGNLIEQGDISEGFVDNRSICSVSAKDLGGFHRCHFFAGIGCWDYALQLANWPKELEVWTGSCPCQPFSQAGKQKGFNDERHLWPIWFELIKKCRPPVIFGEQSANKGALEWLDLVSSDLENEGYSFGAADLCAACVGAPHIRQRLYFVAYSNSTRRDGESVLLCGGRSQQEGVETAGCRQASVALGNAHQQRLEGWEETGRSDQLSLGKAGLGSVRVADTCSFGRQQIPRGPLSNEEEDGRKRWNRSKQNGDNIAPSDGKDCNFWGGCEWVPCRDSHARPIEPGTFPLVDGAVYKLGSGCPQEGQNRAKMIEGYGNAIVAPLAATFISSFLEVMGSR